MALLESKKEPLVSVVVPIYNVADFLPECVDSICRQTYSNIEILLVNDGSTDKSGEICEQYAKTDSRIRVIRKENGGLVTARKVGIANANGKYIANIDADDWIDSNMIQVLVERILEDDAEIVQCGYVEEGIRHGLHTFPDFTMVLNDNERKTLLEEWLSERVRFGSPIVTKLCKAEVLKEIYMNVPDNMSIGEDYISHVGLLCVLQKISSLSFSLYHYRIRHDSISHYQNGIQLMMCDDLLTCYLADLIKCKFPTISTQILGNWILRRKLYRLRDTMKQYGYLIPLHRFPYVNKLLDKHIAIYGAGAVGRDFIMQLSEYTRIYIECWVDKQFEKYNYPFREVEQIATIKEKEWDFIIIAILDEKVAEEIKDSLMLDYGISEEKIIWKYERNLDFSRL